MTRPRTNNRHHGTAIAWAIALAQGCVLPPGGGDGDDGTGDGTETASATATATDGEDDDSVGTTEANDGTGMVPGDTEDTGDTSDTGDTGEPGGCELDVGASVQQALTRRQYENTIEDLLGIDRGLYSSDAVWAPFPVGSVGPFDSIRTDAVGIAPGYDLLATEVSLLADPAQVLPCPLPAADPPACAEAFVTSFGRAAWRRPLEAAEVTDLLIHYDGADMVTGTREAIRDMLSSPNMWQLGRTGTPAEHDPDILLLDDWSLATRLAYFLWNSTPDDALLDHAAAGDLSDEVVLLSEAQRLLADPRAERMLADMYTALMGVEDLQEVTKDTALFPQFGPSLLQAMEQELGRFVADAILGQGDGRIETLLDAPFTFVDDQLAALYGDDLLSTEGTPGPGTYVRASLDPARRGGLLALPAVMTRHSQAADLGYTMRGLTIRNNLLCQSLPPPPPDVVGQIDYPDPPFDRYAFWETLMPAECQACHVLSDPLSFAFDHYDALGRWQSEIHGFAVDASGEVVSVSGVADTSFDGRAELVDVLTATDELPACMVQQHLRFALRRLLSEADECAVEALVAQLEQSDGDLRGLMLDIVASDTFRAARE